MRLMGVFFYTLQVRKDTIPRASMMEKGSEIQRQLDRKAYLCRTSREAKKPNNNLGGNKKWKESKKSLPILAYRNC